ncbi:2Fe-2S iron-sulfur cluster-binding protein, partial [Akkermansiaceae bacterium]|nr:2Fe-2S iron-sulfur cluster-binding protein [Akkermansiaceae bacterium]
MINDPNSNLSAQLSITIDGTATTFDKGETIYEISKRLQRDIPTLCYDDRLEAFGGCRLCVVEVEGIRNPIASCTTQANDGMIVKTSPPKIEKMRKTLLELVASENKDAEVDPLRGLASQELSTLVNKYGARNGRFKGKQSGTSNTDDLNPFILRDYDNCISCYRCVRV